MNYKIKKILGTTLEIAGIGIVALGVKDNYPLAIWIGSGTYITGSEIKGNALVERTKLELEKKKDLTHRF